MNTPTFVLSVAAPRPFLSRSAVLGRPVARAVPAPPTRRVTVPLIFACQPSDPPTEAAASPDLVQDAASEPAPAESEAEPVAAPEAIAEPEALGQPEALAEPEAIGEPEVLAEPKAIAEPEGMAEPEATAEPEAIAEPETGVVAESDEDAAPSAAEAETGVVAEDSEKYGRKDGQKRRRRRHSRKREVTLPLDQITVGMELEGTVKSVMDYGAFVGDMGTPTDGLLHVSQLAAGFVQNVTDVVNVGDKLKVRVLSVDVEKGNFSLTMKTAEEMEAASQPRSGRKEGSKEVAAARRDERNRRWDEFKFDPEVFVDAKVMSVTDFGGFCQLIDEKGEALESCPTDGLIHISELSEERVSKVSDVLTVGQIVKVRVTATDRKRNRISMSLRPVGSESGEDEGSSVVEGIANAEKNQPAFKTTFELAFERAKMPSQK